MAAGGAFAGAIRYREPTGNSALARARHNARATAGAQISVPSNDPSWHGPPFAALPQTKADQHRWLSGLGPAEYDFDLGSADLRAIKPGDDPKIALLSLTFYSCLSIGLTAPCVIVTERLCTFYAQFLAQRHILRSHADAGGGAHGR